MNLLNKLSRLILSDDREKRGLKYMFAFIGGFCLGQLYYNYLLRTIPFPWHTRVIFSLILSTVLGIGNVISIQIRCISLLIFPMYCGKAGRGVLKAVVLTYVVAGPIMNMGLNAKEVVRVFACSTRLSYNLSKAKYDLMATPFKKGIFGLKNDVGEAKDMLRSIGDMAAPIESEVEGLDEMSKSREEIDNMADLFNDSFRSADIDKKYIHLETNEESEVYQKQYLKKIEYRCENQISRGTENCLNTFATAYENCYLAMPWFAGWLLCWPMKLSFVCNIRHVIGDSGICDSKMQIDPGLGEGYVYFKKSKTDLLKNFKDVKIQYKISTVRELIDIQDAQETGQRVMHSFEEKNIIMKIALNVLTICMALLFLRIVVASQDYHDRYLVCIGHDNIYITDYFKRIDLRRKEKKKQTLLPLKKMERSKYVDVHSIMYVTAERQKLLLQTLKLMLEVVTATTFVMLDRLLYEALDVVRQHAEVEFTQKGSHDLEVDVEGTGMIADIVRKVLSAFNVKARVIRNVSNKPCLPRPRLMPYWFFVKIYGGYLWIFILLYFNVYTLRLRRLICSYFYPRREKQRILHLYNDILKKRIKMVKTLRKKAIQSVRAYYLSGENMLSLRQKFPKMLGWLHIFPAARMKCLICGVTEPRTYTCLDDEEWHACYTIKCPFVYCPECWHEIGECCLACDPKLGDVSDIDSLTEDEQPPRY